MRTTNVDQVLPSISSMFLWLSNTKSMTFGTSWTYTELCKRICNFCGVFQMLRYSQFFFRPMKMPVVTFIHNSHLNRSFDTKSKNFGRRKNFFICVKILYCFSTKQQNNFSTCWHIISFCTSDSKDIVILKKVFFFCTNESSNSIDRVATKKINVLWKKN